MSSQDHPGCGRRHLTRVGAVWGLPNTVLGLGFACASGAIPRRCGGLLLAVANRGLARLFLTRRGFSAVTFGRVVVCTLPPTPDLLVHEGHHARQYDVLGPFFLPVYLWHQLRRGYWENPLELEAAACSQRWAARKASMQSQMARRLPPSA